MDKTYVNFTRMRQAVGALNANDVDAFNRLWPLIKPDKYSKDYHNLPGLLYLKQGNLDAALNEANLTIQLQPYYGNSYLFLSLVHLARRDKTATFSALYKALSLDQNNPELLYALASMYDDLNQSDSLEYYARRLIAIDSSKINACYYLAKCCALAGNGAEAVKWAESYYSKEKNLPLLDSRRQLLKRILDRQ